MVATIFGAPNSSDRLAQLWADLLNDPVPPHPTIKHEKTVQSLLSVNDKAVFYSALEAKRMEPFIPSQDKPVKRIWKKGIETLFQSLLEPENATAALPSADAKTSEGEVLSEISVEAAYEAVLSLRSPFRWEPKPAWINTPAGSNPAFLNKADPRLFVAKPKIPIRPLHKQPFYRRIFFYLRRWLR